MYQTLCALYFVETPGLLATYGGKLLADVRSIRVARKKCIDSEGKVYLLLRETLEVPGANAAQLRDKYIGRWELQLLQTHIRPSSAI